MLGRNIDLTATSHLNTQTARDILKSFWCIYVLYLKHGFKITTLHTAVKFAPVKELIAKISSAPMVNLMSDN